MHIGIDFDNTIINYKNLFCESARALYLLHTKENLSKDQLKQEILYKQNNEKGWVTLQGYVYGHMIKKATISKGFTAFLHQCQIRHIPILLISYKTKFTYIGEKINLHDAAYDWLKRKKILDTNINRSSIFFASTVEEKIALIKKSRCTHFIDDLTSVLTHSQFPKNVVKILYSPELNMDNSLPFFSGNWSAIAQYLLSS